MKVISEINGSGLYAQSALSASTASYDSLGNEITATYATKSEIPSLDGLMETDKLEFDSNNKITAYNGSAFAGQSSTSDLVYFDYEDGTPELTWTEIQAYMDAGKQLIIYDRNAVSDGKTKFGYVSNYNKADKFIQFNNVGNTTSGTTPITGINWAYLGNSLGWQRTGAQGGGGIAEVVTSEPITGNGTTESPIGANTVDVNYQEITHDDSLVHVSNDAQYALGVNTRMFPCDETVLWEGNEVWPQTLTLKEPVTNFEKIEIINGHYQHGILHGDQIIGNNNSTVYYHYMNTSASNFAIYACNYSANGTTLKSMWNRTANLTTSGATYTNNNTDYLTRILKVIGIGRK